MKVVKHVKFSPVSIVLESREDFTDFLEVIRFARNQAFQHTGKASGKIRKLSSDLVTKLGGREDVIKGTD